MDVGSGVDVGKVVDGEGVSTDGGEGLSIETIVVSGLARREKLVTEYEEVGDATSTMEAGWEKGVPGEAGDVLAL